MKKVITYITSIIAGMLVVGCAACREWASNIDWNSVNTIVIPVVQTTAQNAVYLACDKNPDLKPIFNTVGNSILLAIADSKFDATQIKAYIKESLGKDAEKYYPIVASNLDMIFTGYMTFYNTNWNIKDTDTAGDKASTEAVFSKYLSAVATGIMNGTKMTAETAKLASAGTAKFSDVCAMQVIK